MEVDITGVFLKGETLHKLEDARHQIFLLS